SRAAASGFVPKGFGHKQAKPADPVAYPYPALSILNQAQQPLARKPVISGKTIHRPVRETSVKAAVSRQPQRPLPVFEYVTYDMSLRLSCRHPQLNKLEFHLAACLFQPVKPSPGADPDCPRSVFI